MARACQVHKVLPFLTVRQVTPKSSFPAKLIVFNAGLEYECRLGIGPPLVLGFYRHKLLVNSNKNEHRVLSLHVCFGELCLPSPSYSLPHSLSLSLGLSVSSPPSPLPLLSNPSAMVGFGLCGTVDHVQHSFSI